MRETQLLASQEQRVGRRLGLEPYYTVANFDADGLQLVSRPEANRKVGRITLGVGVVLMILGLALALSGSVSALSGAGFGVAALAAVIAGLLGSFAYQRILGGYAILTTENQVICDRIAGTITFEQKSKIGRARVQRLFFAQISGLRLRRRPLAVGWPLRRVVPIVALELLVDQQVWVVDSAADAEALRPAAEGLATLLERPFQS